MKETRIIAFVGMFGCLNLSNTTHSNGSEWFWIAAAGLWLVFYAYLTLKKEGND